MTNRAESLTNDSAQRFGLTPESLGLPPLVASKIRMNSESGCWEWAASRDKNGYGYTWAVPGQTRAHRAVWSFVHGSIPAGMFVCHHCDNPCCCNPDHLFLGTPKDNMDDMREKGRDRPTGAKGEAHAKAKITDHDVRAILSMYDAGTMQKDIADKFGVSRDIVSCIVRGETWKHLPEVSRRHLRRSQSGSTHTKAKLTDRAVRQIFELREQKWTLEGIGEFFGVSKKTILNVVHRRTWAHVDLEV